MMETREPRWTIKELVQEVEKALQLDYWGQANGRIKDFPTLRAVRLYTMLGLLDRPILKGRTGYYHLRHLMQLVAIKRLQAEGLSLVAIQNKLLGLSDEELAQIAKLPEESRLRASAPLSHQPVRKRARFWQPAALASEAPAEEMEAKQAETWQSVLLTPGVRLILEGDFLLDQATIREIQQAARPLLRALQNRGLIRPVSLFHKEAQDHETD